MAETTITVSGYAERRGGPSRSLTERQRAQRAERAAPRSGGGMLRRAISRS
jgi:hypothetical protein